MATKRTVRSKTTRTKTLPYRAAKKPRKSIVTNDAQPKKALSAVSEQPQPLKFKAALSEMETVVESVREGRLKVIAWEAERAAMAPFVATGTEDELSVACLVTQALTGCGGEPDVAGAFLTSLASQLFMIADIALAIEKGDSPRSDYTHPSDMLSSLAWQARAVAELHWRVQSARGKVKENATGFDKGYGSLDRKSAEVTS
jgi:hypothetical protein